LALEFFDKAKKSGDCDKTELERVERTLHEVIEARNAAANPATPKS